MLAEFREIDWEALRAKYEPLIAHVGHRSDLNYVIGEMIAELNVSHAYIAGGDENLPARPHVALLGARFELDAGAGRYRVALIEGRDPQLERAIAEVMQKVTAEPKVLPTRPAPPVKTPKAMTPAAAGR